MTADARISSGLPSHPKTKKLIRRLGPSGAWSLVCLILWVASNRSDGRLHGMSDEDIELAAEWGGDDGALVRELVAVRFLDGQPEDRSMHDWAEHNPWAAGADMRSAKARWNAAKRHHGPAEADRQVPEYAAVRNADSNASSTKPALQEHGCSNAPSPSPSPSPSKSRNTSPVGEAPTKRRQKTPIPDGFAVSDRVSAWADAKGYTRLPEHLEAFRRKCAANAYTYADWDDAFMEAIREDWAKLRGRGTSGAAPPPDASTSTAADETQRYLAEQAAHRAKPPPEVLALVRKAIA